jgi:hypothetical protein
VEAPDYRGLADVPPDFARLTLPVPLEPGPDPGPVPIAAVTQPPLDVGPLQINILELLE